MELSFFVLGLLNWVIWRTLRVGPETHTVGHFHVRILDLSQMKVSMLYYLCICSKGDKKFISYRLSVTNSIKLIIFALLNMYFQTISKWNSDGSNSISSNIERTRISFLNIEKTQTCSLIIYRTWTSEFWLRMNGHRTSNLRGLHWIY